MRRSCSADCVGRVPASTRRCPRFPSKARYPRGMPPYLKTLFVNPPSWQGFDGGAGSRYQAKREIRSFWYPTWLAQPAALVPGSRLVDAPPHDLTKNDILRIARDYELVVIHTSAPTLRGDATLAEALK